MDGFSYFNYYYIPSAVPLYETNQNQLTICDQQLCVLDEQNIINEVDNYNCEADAIPLPKELTDMFKPLECDLCGVSVVGPASAYTHYEGKTHIKNVNSYMKEHYNVKGSLKVKKEHFTPQKCDVCNIDLTSKIVYQQHFYGKQHLKNVMKKQYSSSATDNYSSNEENETKYLISPSHNSKILPYACNVCNISTNTELQLEMHKNGQKHKKKLMKLGEMNLNYEFYNQNWDEISENTFRLTTESENGLPSNYLENPEMDFPLQFNNIQSQVENEANVSSSNKMIVNNEITAAPAQTTSSIASDPPLEAIVRVPISIECNNEKIVSSLGIFLKHLTVINENNAEDSQEYINEFKQKIISDNGATSCESSHPEKVDPTLLEGSNSNVQNTHTEISTINHKNKTDSDKSTNSTNIANYSIEQASITDLEAITNSAETNSNSETSSKIENSENSNSVDLVDNKKPSIPNKISEISSNQYLEQSNPSENLVVENESVPGVVNDVSNHKLDEKMLTSGDNKSKLKSDQELTKLAIEEIEKECIEFNKMHNSNKIFVNEENEITKEEPNVRKEQYKYDKAGFRIKEKLLNSNENKKEYEKREDKEYDTRRNYNSRYTSYYNGNNWNRSFRWNNYPNKWKRNNYWMQRNHGWNRYENERNGYYRTNYHQNYDNRSDKRKRKRFSSDEDDEYYYDSKKHNRYEHERKRSPVSSKKYESSSNHYKKRSRSSSDDSSYSERSSHSSRRDKNDRRKHREKSSKNNNDKINKSHHSSRRRSHSTDSNNSSYSGGSSLSTNNKDYMLDKNGYCVKLHRCLNAYNKCQHKHKEPFKIKTELKEQK